MDNMREEIDTDYVRGRWNVPGSTGARELYDINALCDALDEARAEACYLRGEHDPDATLRHAAAMEDRAEKAEGDAKKAWECAASRRDEARKYFLQAEANEAKLARVEALRDAWNMSFSTMHLAERLDKALDES